PPNSDVPPPPAGVCLASDGTAVSIAVGSRLVTPLSCCPYTVGSRLVDRELGARESAGSAAAVDDRDDPYASAALRSGADHSPSAPSSKVRGAIAVLAQNTDLLLVVPPTKRAAKGRAMAGSGRPISP